MHKLSLRAVKSMGKRPTTTPMMTMSSRRVAAAAAFAVSATVSPTAAFLHSARVGQSTPALAFGTIAPGRARFPSRTLSVERSLRHMSSVAVDTESSAESTDPSATTPAAVADSKGGTKIFARGEMVHFSTGPASVGSVAAVRMREEDLIPPGTNVEEMGSKPSVVGAQADGAILDIDVAQKAMAKAGAGKGVDSLGRIVRFPSGKTGMVVADRPPIAFVLCDFSEEADAGEAEERGSVSIMVETATLQASDDMAGRVVDFMGRIIDGGDDIVVDGDQVSPLDRRAIFAPIPKVGDIALINSPMLTGKAMIDALAPVGKGQNTLLIGTEGSELRSLGIDAIVNQVNIARAGDEEGVRCIYALTSNDAEDRADILSQLDKAGVRDSVVVVAARMSEMGTSDEEDSSDAKVRASAEAVSVAAAACAIGESHALTKGRDSLVIIDSIDHHKDLWDWTTRVLVDVYGIDAVVKDDMEGGASSEMRGFYSSLIQRAGKYKVSKGGGGSVTLAMIRSLPGQMAGSGEEDEMIFSSDDFEGAADKVKERIAILTKSNIPLTPTNLCKIQIPVPKASESEKVRRLALQHVDDLISMSDGQIWLDERLSATGQRPSLDPQRSITRVGIGADTASRADAPAMRGLAGGLRFELAQAAALEGAGEGSGADRQVRRRDAWMLAMQQGAGEGRTLAENAVALLAASMGSLDGVVRAGGAAGTEEGASAIASLIEYVRRSSPSEMKELDKSLDLSNESRTVLEEAIRGHFDSKK